MLFRLPFARRGLIGASLAVLLGLAAAPLEAGDVKTMPVARTTTYRAAGPMTGMQLAAHERFTYTDARTHVILQSGHLRIRLYPGTNKAVVAGREYTLKDRIERTGRDVYLTDRVVRFLRRQAGVFRAQETARRTVVVAKPRAPRPRPARRKPTVVTKEKKPAPAPEPAARPAARTDSSAWAVPGDDREWRYIVLHHSDDESGSVAKYDRYHRYTKRWEHGCGYHFVIGNGTETGDGEVEMGPRWTQQLHGAHAKTPDNRYNDFGVGICLVGDFDVGTSRPSGAQMDALVELTRWLQERYDIPGDRVLGHCDCCPTCCPGKNFPWDEYRKRIK